MLAGFFSTCFGKRVDIKCLGVYAMVVELIALCACGASIAFSTLALEDDVAVIENGKVCVHGLQIFF